jgi:hypothetical protein
MSENMDWKHHMVNNGGQEASYHSTQGLLKQVPIGTPGQVLVHHQNQTRPKFECQTEVCWTYRNMEWSANKRGAIMKKPRAFARFSTYRVTFPPLSGTRTRVR